MRNLKGICCKKGLPLNKTGNIGIFPVNLAPRISKNWRPFIHQCRVWIKNQWCKCNKVPRLGNYTNICTQHFYSPPSAYPLGGGGVTHNYLLNDIAWERDAPLPLIVACRERGHLWRKKVLYLPNFFFTFLKKDDW